LDNELTFYFVTNAHTVSQLNSSTRLKLPENLHTIEKQDLATAFYFLVDDDVV
jgi:hypothetical protein